MGWPVAGMVVASGLAGYVGSAGQTKSPVWGAGGVDRAGSGVALLAGDAQVEGPIGVGGLDCALYFQERRLVVDGTVGAVDGQKVVREEGRGGVPLVRFEGGEEGAGDVGCSHGGTPMERGQRAMPPRAGGPIFLQCA